MRYYCGLAFAIGAVSFTAILIRLAEAPALTIATDRMVLAVLLQLPALLLLDRHGLRRIGRHDLLLTAAAGVFLAFHFGLWTLSLDFTSVASSVVFVSIHPIFVTIFAWAFLREKLTPWVLVGIGLTWLGSLLIGLNDLRLGGEALSGDLLAAAGAAAMVGYLLLGKQLRSRHSFLVYTTLVYAACAAALAMMALAAGSPLLPSSNTDLALFFALAVATLGGHTVFNWVLRHVPASVVAVSFVGEPAGAAFLAWLILAEPIGALTAAGGLAMLAGIYATARPRR